MQAPVPGHGSHHGANLLRVVDSGLRHRFRSIVATSNRHHLDLKYLGDKKAMRNLALTNAHF